MKQVIVFGGLLGLALAGSWWTWRAEDGEEAAASEVVVYNADPSSLQSVHYVSDDLEVTLAQRKDEAGEYIWVETSEKKKKRSEEAPEDEEEADASPAEPEVESVSEAFVGNEAATDLWKAFAPLTALRQLSKTGAEADAFGFDASKGTVTVQRASGPVTLTLGGESYGTRNQYVGMGDDVFLLDAKVMRPLQSAGARLSERRVQPLSEEAIDRVEVAFGGSKAAWVQKNQDDRTKAYWAADGTDTEDVIAGTWLGKAFRIRVQDYLTDGDAPSDVELVFTVRVTGDGGSWDVPVFRSTADGETAWYARPTLNRTLVRLTTSLASEAAEDVATLFEARPSEDAPIDEAPTE